MTSDRIAERDAIERLERAKPGPGVEEDELLPGGPDTTELEDEALAAGAAARDEADGKQGKSPIVMRAPRIKLPALPGNLDAAVWEGGATLTLVSLNHPIANVSATLVFALDFPHFDDDLQGEHAYTAGFLGGFLGEGVTLLEVTSKVDEENRVGKKVKVRVPRYLNEQHDQILLNIAPLIGGRKMIEALMSAEGTWGLNFRGLTIQSDLRLFQMQQAFDLTARAE